MKVQYRASLEQDFAAVDEFKPDLAIGTTPVVQKAKTMSIPALYFTNLISARPLFGAAGAGSLAQVINAALGNKARFDEMIRRDGNRMSPSLVRQVAMASDWTGADYQKAMFQRADLFRMVQKWFETADYVVTPTLSRTALPIEQDLFEPINIDGIEAGELRRNWFPYTMPFNITGHPAVTVNCGFDGDGLPIGMQIVGRFREDWGVLQLGHAFEQATKVGEKRPPIAS